MFFGHVEYLAMPLLFAVRFCVTLEICLNFYVVYELFPPHLASMVYGACNVTAGLAAIMSPMAVEKFRNSLLIVFVIGCVCVLLCSFITSGTKNLV